MKLWPRLYQAVSDEPQDQSGPILNLLARDARLRRQSEIRNLELNLNMDGILRFSGTVERDPAIDAWMKEQPGVLRSIARQWFGVMRKCGDEFRELMHDGCPVACVGDAPFCYVNAFTAHVNVGFFHGAELPDPAGLLQGSGKHMRHVKLK